MAALARPNRAAAVARSRLAGRRLVRMDVGVVKFVSRQKDQLCLALVSDAFVGGGGGVVPAALARVSAMVSQRICRTGAGGSGGAVGARRGPNPVPAAAQ